MFKCYIYLCGDRPPPIPQRPGLFLGGEFRRGGGGRFLGISTGAAVISWPSTCPESVVCGFSIFKSNNKNKR